MNLVSRCLQFAVFSALALVLLTSNSISAATENTRSKVEEALRLLDAAEQDANWHFTMTVVEDEEQRVVRHNPLLPLPEQRALISVEGKDPGKKQLAAFRKQEEQRIKDRDPEANYSYLVDSTTLKAAASPDTLVEFSFSPRIKQMEKFRSELAGRLLLNTRTDQIELIEIYNTEPFSPTFSVKLQDYRLTFRFRDEQGASLLHSIDSTAVGRAGFLKKFDIETRISFSDYSPASVAASE